VAIVELRRVDGVIRSVPVALRGAGKTSGCVAGNFWAGITIVPGLGRGGAPLTMENWRPDEQVTIVLDPWSER